MRGTAFNTTTVVQESINEVIKTLAEAIGLVIIVMFLFLQSWRATIIPALTMPVSLMSARSRSCTSSASRSAR